MCHVNCIVFGVNNLTQDEIKGKRVIEVGSYNVNGSIQPIIRSWGPAEYIGLDMQDGPGVNTVCNAEDMVEKFGKESFDVVISTELLEHAKNWQNVISNIKNICKPDGIILITTRSNNFPYHAWPYDYWRYETEDMKQIFSDCQILTLEEDNQDLGIFIKVKKPKNFKEKKLSNYKLKNIISGKRVKKITRRDFLSFHFIFLSIKEKLKNFIIKLGRLI